AALVPTSSGLTVAAPVSTWSLMPSFGNGVSATAAPHTRTVLVSFSQNRNAGSAPSGPGAALRWYVPRRRGLATSASPERMIEGLSVGGAFQLHALWNQRCGSTWMTAASGPAFSTVTFMQTSVGDALAYSTVTTQ